MDKEQAYNEIIEHANELVQKVQEFQKVHKYHKRMQLIKALQYRIKQPLDMLNKQNKPSRFKLMTTGKGTPNRQPLAKMPPPQTEGTVLADNSPEGMRKIKENKAVLDARFNSFWSAYDYKRNKQDARKAWDNLEEWEQEDAVKGIQAYKESSGAKIDLPATYLRSKAWS